MTTTPDATSFALSARIFHAAMQRQASLDAYAATLDIPGDMLRAMLSAQTGELPPDMVARLAASHGQRGDATLASSTTIADTEPFSTWLERQMEGVPQASLRGRAQLEARVLRAFLSGKALPDADQAERLARALYVNSGEMARVIVADMIRRAGAPPGQRGSATGAEAAGASPLATQSSAPPDAPARTRRRRPAADATQTPAATTPPEEAAPAPTATPPAPSESAQTEADPLVGGARPDTPARERRRRSAKPSAAPGLEAMPAPPAPAPGAAQAEAEAPQADAPPMVDAGPPPPTSPRKGRRAGGAIPLPAAPGDASAGDGSFGTAPASRAPRRSGHASATAPTDVGEAVPEAGAQGDSLQHVGERPTTPDAPTAADHAPVGTDSPGTSTRAPAQPATAERRTATGRATSAPTAAAVGSSAEALELSPDEVRLILGYRRLHPHGRRATLHYIGSLLIDE